MKLRKKTQAFLCILCLALLLSGCKSAGDPANTTVDIDLTTLEGNMLFAEATNILSSPENYLGKCIKISGPYYPSLWKGVHQDNYHHYILIQDTTACCKQGLEFIWEDNKHRYPEEYPKAYAAITLTGTFSSYTDSDSGQDFYCLKVDTIETATPPAS